MPQPRYRYRSSYFRSSFPPGIKWLLISNTVILISYGIGPLQPTEVFRLFGLNKEISIRLVWQLFTYMFLHGGVGHLLFNMLALWMFGSPLESDWGTRRFLRYYFICGVGAGICDLLVSLLIVGGGPPTIGASGAIYGVLLAFGVCYPEQTVLMNFLFPIKAKYLVMIYGAIALYSSMGVNTSVSNIAHLGGMVVGFLYLKSHIRHRSLRLPDIQGAYNQWKLERAKRKFQTYMKKHDR